MRWNHTHHTCTAAILLAGITFLAGATARVRVAVTRAVTRPESDGFIDAFAVKGALLRFCRPETGGFIEATAD